MQSNLLKSERAKHGLTQKQLCQKLDIDVSSYSKKENAVVQFKQSEINAIRRLLNLTPDMIIKIFFTDELELNSSIDV